MSLRNQERNINFLRCDLNGYREVDNLLFMNRVVITASKRLLGLRAYFSEVTRSRGQAPAQRDRLQFSKSRLVDFGELPHGEIPTALQFSRPTTMEKLENRVTVVTEQWSGNQAA